MIGGFIIVSTGVTGLYIGKIFTQVKDRPIYVVDVVLDSEPPTTIERTGKREPVEAARF
jgi:hypothetical protein